MNNLIPTDQFDQEVLDLVNEERTQRGLNKLELSEKLDTAADQYSQEMIDQDHFSHTGPDGSSPGDRIENAGYTQWRSWAENIAAGQQTAADVVQGWMDSPGHRANILSDSVTHMGLGYAEGNARYGTRWTQVFAAGDPNPGEYTGEAIGGSPTPTPTPDPMPTPTPDPMPTPTPDPMPTPTPDPMPTPTPDPMPTPTPDPMPTPTPDPMPTPTPDPMPTPTPDPMPTPSPDPNPGSGDGQVVPTDQFDQEVLQLVNQQRTSRGLNPLTLSEKLDTAADDYSEEMIKDNHFSHTGKDGSSPGDRIEKAGYTDWNTWAENIAAGQQTAQDVVNAWMNSPGHRANILNDRVTHMGLGYAEGANARYGNRWTQVFAAGESNPGLYAPETEGTSPAPAPDPTPVPDPMPMPDPTPTPVPAPNPGSGQPLDLSGIESYGGPYQDRNSRTRVWKNNTALRIRGNGWKRLGIDYNVTPDTMMKVEFRSRAEGEIQGIGFDNDNRIRGVDKERLFQFAGAQQWGNDAFDDYVTGEGWKTYEIPIGEYFTGNVDYLTFANDHDVRRPKAISDFRNIELFESSGGMGDSMDPSNDPLQGDSNPMTNGNGFSFPVAPPDM